MPAAPDLADNSRPGAGSVAQKLFLLRGRVAVVESAWLQLHLSLTLCPRGGSWQQCPDLPQVHLHSDLQIS